MKTTIFCLLTVLLFTAETCEKTEVSQQEVAFPSESCGTDKKVVKTVASVEGIISFDAALQQYIIRRSVPGTFDSVDYGILCGNIPTSLQSIGSKVLFSGTYKEYDKPSPAVMGGQSFYYLDLSKVALLIGK